MSLVEESRVRPSWDEYFLQMCESAKLRSIDVDTQNGAVIANSQHRIVSTGYNAFPAGVDDQFWPNARNQKQNVPHVNVPRYWQGQSVAAPLPAPAAKMSSQYLQDDCFYTVDKYMAMTHAEMNAVVAAGQDLHGCCIYTLLFPCHECAKAIITAGIKRVVYQTTREHVSWAVAKELFVQAGVELVGPEKP
jgi:dCMP deaminase